MSAIEIAQQIIETIHTKFNYILSYYVDGNSNMSFTIDDSISKNMWGKEEVLLKLRPFDLSAGKIGSYSGGTIPDEIENSLNYFAVRCNKSGTEN